MEKDYNLLIENLKGRRYDEARRESLLSESFKQGEHSDCIRYTLESMLEIDPSFAYKVYATSRKIHEKIAKALTKRGYTIDYRYQGELKTYSNILLYGDVEIIVIKKNVTPKPHVDVQNMAMDIMQILKGDSNFKSIDYSDKTRIRITATKPTCEIDILPSIWVDSLEYRKTKNEIYRGIAEFDFRYKKVKKYLPFLNIARINAKDQHVGGSLKSISRLLKTLRADGDERINLKDSEINAIVYSLSEEDLKVEPNKILSLLPVVNEKLTSLYKEVDAFKGLLAPSEKDRVFAGRPDKQKEIWKLKKELSALISDLSRDLSNKNLTLDSPIEYNDSIN